uniref:Protein odr-4 homolog n=1 Tax=Oncorhynchus kisutch TaxID=8019 RepID=A0A8C7JIX9_ONCKI
MGRGYIVEDVVEKYLSNLSVPGASCVTGLLIGQSSSQRDFVVLAVRTPQKDTEGQGSPSVSRGAGNSLEHLDVEWVTEHARQVSRMLPGGMSVIGVFLVTPPELSKEGQNTLRRLIFAVDKHISKGRLWSLTEEDVTEKVTLHICSKTRKVVCRTYDVRDPKSSAKPADWKYQSGVCTSWPLLTCSVGLNLVFPVLEMHVLPQDMEKCMKEGLQTWAKQIEDGLCLINGDAMPGEVELLGGQAEPQSERRLTASVKVCSGSLTLKGMVQCRAYLHSNKPRAKHATEVIKRDVINTVSSRVEMFLEDLLMEGEDKGSVGVQQVLPRRVFAPVPGMSLCVCDYMFPDECVSDVSDRLKEMLDWETPEDSIDTSQEAVPEAPTIDLKNTVVQKNLKAKSTLDARPKTPSEDPTEAHKSHKTYYAGVAMAAAIALLATGTSLIYLSD